MHAPPAASLSMSALSRPVSTPNRLTQVTPPSTSPMRDPLRSYRSSVLATRPTRVR